MVHYTYTDEEAVIQISTTGPWSVDYLNPADDPRNKPKKAERDAPRSRPLVLGSGDPMFEPGLQ